MKIILDEEGDLYIRSKVGEITAGFDVHSFSLGFMFYYNPVNKGCILSINIGPFWSVGTMYFYGRTNAKTKIKI